MLLAARGRAPEAGLLAADATALPFPDAAADLTLARHDFAGQLRVPSPEPVAAYVRGMREAARLPDSRPLAEAVTGRLQAAPDGFFRITTHSGCLVCA